MRNQQLYIEKYNTNLLSKQMEWKAEYARDRDRQQGKDKEKKRRPNDEKANKDANL